MYELEIEGHKIGNLASEAITLLESLHGIRLNPTQRYFLGKAIQLKSGKSIEIKESKRYKTIESAMNGL